LKIVIQDIGEFDLQPGQPLKRILSEIKKVVKKLPVGFKFQEEY
jgi:threonyl-tRNA synthetase